MILGRRHFFAAVTAAFILLQGCAAGSLSSGNNTGINKTAEIDETAKLNDTAKVNDTAGTDVSRPEAGAGEAAQPGKDYGLGRIPEFSTEDLSGKSYDNGLFKEKNLTFINYWATWCPPCRGELPDFQALYDKYGDKMTFVTVIDDAVGNDEASKLAGQYLSFCVNLNPDSKLISELQTGYVPTSVIVDSDGYLVIDKMIGAYGGEYAGYIDEALKKLE